MAIKAKTKPEYRWQGSQLTFPKRFTSPLDKAEVEKRIRDYLEALDYKPAGAEPLFIYRRGSMLARFYSTSPRNLPTQIVVNLSSDIDLNIDIDVSLTIIMAGAVASHHDYDFWQLEIDDLVTAVVYGYINPLHSRYAADRAKWFGCWLSTIVLFVLGSIGLLLISAILSLPHCGC